GLDDEHLVSDLALGKDDVPHRVRHEEALERALAAGTGLEDGLHAQIPAGSGNLSRAGDASRSSTAGAWSGTVRGPRPWPAGNPHATGNLAPRKRSRRYSRVSSAGSVRSRDTTEPMIMP